MSWRNFLSLGFLVLAIAGGIYVYLTSRQFSAGEVLVAGTVRVHVDVAATDLTREQGLSGKEGLSPNQGMWFIFPTSDAYIFWMKDMLFPIDIIWVNEGKIVDLAANVPPPADLPPGPLPRYQPAEPADRVLEVSAGFAQRHGLKVGDSVEFIPPES